MIAEALYGMGFLLGGAQRGEQQSGQDGYDGYDHQQFNQGETEAGKHRPMAGSEWFAMHDLESRKLMTHSLGSIGSDAEPQKKVLSRHDIFSVTHAPMKRFYHR